MKKIISLFQRNYAGDRLVRDEVTLGAEWVIRGEGWPSCKLDGTCCMVRAGKFYKRYDAKLGRIPPPTFEPAQDPDPITKHWPGWIPVDGKPEDHMHREAFSNFKNIDGTYELVGPKINGNPEGVAFPCLVRHGIPMNVDVPRTFEGLRKFFIGRDIEGVVWHHPDGPMVKIKKKDFGLSRKD